MSDPGWTASSTELHPAPTADGDGVMEVTVAKLSPEGRRIAFVGQSEGRHAIYVGAARTGAAASGADAAQKLVEPSATVLDDLSWSPDGSHVAYRIAGDPPGFGDQIGWASSSALGQRGQTGGTAHAWTKRSDALFVGDVDQYEVARVLLATDGRSRLAELLHCRTAGWQLRLVLAPDWRRLAFTSRDEIEDTARVWCLGRQDGAPMAELVTWIPGADAQILPFWSPGGMTLGLFVVHQTQAKTALIVVRGMQGEGEILYEHEAMDAAVAPAWAPDGRTIALLRRGPGSDEQGAGETPNLALLDLSKQSLTMLDEAQVSGGCLRFVADDQLVVEGGPTVHLVRLERT